MFFSTVKFFNAGLGNLLIPMAKAYLASQALKCHLLIPFQVDTRRVKMYFRPIKMGYLPYLPNPFKKITFSFEDYMNVKKMTNTNDYYINVKAFVNQSDHKNMILVNEGMWGGYYSIFKARNWIKTFLISSRQARKDVAERAIYYHPNRIQIGIHIRLGDFEVPISQVESDNKRASLWSTQVPLKWYFYIVDEIQKEVGADNVDFILFTDSRENKDVRDFIKRFNIISVKNKEYHDFSDLYIMSECDLLICSYSSYSMMGAFLSNSPYLMYKDYAIKKDDKYLLWDEDIYSYKSSEGSPRGSLINIDERLNEELILYLKNKIIEKSSVAKELIFGGRI